MNFIKSYKSQRSALWKTTLLFILVSGLLITTDQISIRCGLEGSQRIVDDFLGGFIAGSIFYLYERHRLRKFNEQLHVIDLMNHHIRNALQPLMFLTYEPEAKAQIKLAEHCVDAAAEFRQVLASQPGNREAEQRLTQAQANPTVR